MRERNLHIVAALLLCKSQRDASYKIIPMFIANRKGKEWKKEKEKEKGFLSLLWPK